jgi:hypothetical protein
MPHKSQLAHSSGRGCVGFVPSLERVNTDKRRDSQLGTCELVGWSPERQALSRLRAFVVRAFVCQQAHGLLTNVRSTVFLKRETEAGSRRWVNVSLPTGHVRVRLKNDTTLSRHR